MLMSLLFNIVIKITLTIWHNNMISFINWMDAYVYVKTLHPDI